MASVKGDSLTGRRPFLNMANPNALVVCARLRAPLSGEAAQAIGTSGGLRQVVQMVNRNQLRLTAERDDGSGDAEGEGAEASGQRVVRFDWVWGMSDADTQLWADLSPLAMNGVLSGKSKARVTVTTNQPDQHMLLGLGGLTCSLLSDLEKSNPARY